MRNYLSMNYINRVLGSWKMSANVTHLFNFYLLPWTFMETAICTKSNIYNYCSVQNKVMLNFGGNNDKMLCRCHPKWKGSFDICKNFVFLIHFDIKLLFSVQNSIIKIFFFFGHVSLNRPTKHWFKNAWRKQPEWVKLANALNYATCVSIISIIDTVIAFLTSFHAL